MANDRSSVRTRRRGGWNVVEEQAPAPLQEIVAEIQAIASPGPSQPSIDLTKDVLWQKYISGENMSEGDLNLLLEKFIRAGYNVESIGSIHPSLSKALQEYWKRTEWLLDQLNRDKPGVSQ